MAVEQERKQVVIMLQNDLHICIWRCGSCDVVRMWRQNTKFWHLKHNQLLQLFDVCHAGMSLDIEACINLALIEIDRPILRNMMHRPIEAKHKFC